MGDATRKKRAHAAVLAAQPACIYCTNAADSIEHMPPIGIFARRDRPKGLEFPCCRACNQGTRLSDLVASVMSRLWPNPSPPVERVEMQRLLRSVGTNVPGLLQEMKIGRAGQKLAAKQIGFDQGEFLRADGPILTRHMTVFAAKLGFALFHEVHGRPVPLAGVVRPIYYSNAQAIVGGIPPELFQLLPAESHTLRAGRKHVGDQFDYSWHVDDEAKGTLVFATFRRSFAAGAVIFEDRATLDDGSDDDEIPLFVRHVDVDGKPALTRFDYRPLRSK